MAGPQELLSTHVNANDIVFSLERTNRSDRVIRNLQNVPRQIQQHLPGIITESLQSQYVPILRSSIPRSNLNKPHLQDSVSVGRISNGAVVRVGGPNFPYANKINSMYNYIERAQSEGMPNVVSSIHSQFNQLVRVLNRRL